MVRRLFLVALVACGARPPAETPAAGPELVLVNARIEGNPAASAIAMADGRITAIGGKEVAANAKNVRDLAGATVWPGLRDAHVHLVAYGDVLLGRVCNLEGSTSMADALVRAKAFVAARSLGPNDWVVCTGWNEARWAEKKKPSSTAPLDEAVGDRPAILSRQDGHTAWVSKKALALAKVDRSTKVRGGEVVKDENGEPTGILTDDAVAVVRRHEPPAKDEEIEVSILRALEECKSFGLVEVHDALVFPRWERVFEKLAREGRLPLRVSAMIFLPTADAIEKYMTANAPITKPIGGRLVVRTVKLFADGALGGESAYLTEAYANRPGWSGISRMSRAEIASVARTALAHGWQVATHAIGDAAVHDVLEAYADAGVPSGARFRVEHASLFSDEDVKMFASMDVIASVQPWFPGPPQIAMLGEARARRLSDVKTLHDAGVHIVLGTDVPPGVTAQPLRGIRVSVARGIPKEEAIALASEQTAYAAFAESERGQLRVGQAADLTVYDADPFVKKDAKVVDVYVGK